MKGKIIARLAFYAFLIFPGIVQADSWAFPKMLDKQIRIFGDIKIVLEVDTRQNTVHPEYTLRFIKNSKQIAQHKDIGYSEIFASDDNDYLLAVSSDGIMPACICNF